MQNNMPQPDPSEADYAISTLAQDLAQALAEKATYLGKLTVSERTNQLLIQENQGLRAKLEKLENAAEPEPVETNAPDTQTQPPPADKPQPRTPRGR